MRTPLLVASLALLSACSGSHVPPSVWTGTAEVPGSVSEWSCNRVRIAIDPADTSGVHAGTVVFGCAAAPPVDPARGYPAGAQSTFPIIEGVTYAFSDGRMDASGRWGFTVPLAPSYAAWCAAQTPYPQGSGEYNCLPNLGYSTGTTGCALGDGTPVDCGRLALCSVVVVCACDASACRVGDPGTLSVVLDVSGDTADGAGTLPTRTGTALPMGRMAMHLVAGESAPDAGAAADAR